MYLFPGDSFIKRIAVGRQSINNPIYANATPPLFSLHISSPASAANLLSLSHLLPISYPASTPFSGDQNERFLPSSS